MQKKKSSRELLRESVVELVSQMPVEKVSVNMICENCGLSQRTFYNCFKDKLDLISWTYTRILDMSYKDLSENIPSLHTQMTALVEDICDNAAFYTNVIRYTGQNNFRDSVYLPLRDSCVRLITEIHGDEITADISDAIDFFIFGCLGYMEHNLLIGNIVPAEVTIPFFEKNLPAILSPYL